jgi:long-chain acyl-CoA synthetase
MTDLSNCQTLEIFYHWERTAPDRIYLRQLHNDQFMDFTWAQVADRVRRLANWLQEQGFGNGERIAIYSKNTYDWFVVDLASGMAGCISVPLYAGQSSEQISYILGHSECQLAFVGKLDDASSWQAGCPATIRQVGMFGSDLGLPDTTESIHAASEPLQGDPVPADSAIYSIVYTSGTTGNPKGVMLTGDRLRASTRAAAEIIFEFSEKDVMVSYLPLAHIAERIIVLGGSLYYGCQVGFVQSVETFVVDLRKIEPTVFFSVPRLYTKFKQGIEAKLSPRFLRILQSVPGVRTLFGSFIRKQLGFLNVRIFIVGASPISAEVLIWYKNFGMQIYQAYSQTEMPYGCLVQSDDAPIASVGTAFPGVQVRLSDEGEILFKGDTMMSGYYLNPEKTAETIIDGWLHTGDAGKIDAQGNVFVTGRISETFKTSKGKFVNPSVVEARFGDQTLLDQICVIGLGMVQPVLVATLSELGRKMERAEFVDAVTALVKDVNTRNEAHQKLAAVMISDVDWVPDNGMLTPTLKLRRRQIDEVFRPIAQGVSTGEFVHFVTTS